MRHELRAGLMDSMNPIDLGEYLRKAREALGLPRDELAADLKTTAGTVGRWERNESLPQRRFRTQLVAVLQITEREPLRILGILRSDVTVGGHSPPDGNLPSIDAPVQQALTRNQYVSILAKGLESGNLTNEYFVLVAQVIAPEVDFNNWKTLSSRTKP